MKEDKRTLRPFYQNLGRLFYAIAAADKRVHESEINALKKIVKTEWLPVSNSLTILDVFNWLNTDQDYNAEDCFNGFLEYKNKNEHLFTSKVKQLIMKTGRVIASSFSGKNKSELIFLAKLGIELKKT